MNRNCHVPNGAPSRSFIRKFNRQGHLIGRFPVPDKFLLSNGPGHQSGDLSPDPANASSFELAPFYNTSGRQANRGMEGLAITPDGKKLVGVMQSALIQDHGLVATLDTAGVPTGRLGVNNRILTLDLETSETHEYVYTLDGISSGRGLNEILAINDHEFLVLERDNRSFTLGPTSDPRNKRIYKIDLAQPGLTDVSNVDSLPAAGGAALFALGIVPVQKKLFIDLLKDLYKVSSTQTIKDVIAENPKRWPGVLICPTAGTCCTC